MARRHAEPSATRHAAHAQKNKKRVPHASASTTTARRIQSAGCLNSHLYYVPDHSCSPLTPVTSISSHAVREGAAARPFRPTLPRAATSQWRAEPLTLLVACRELGRPAPSSHSRRNHVPPIPDPTDARERELMYEKSVKRKIPGSCYHGFDPNSEVCAPGAVRELGALRGGLALPSLLGCARAVRPG